MKIPYRQYKQIIKDRAREMRNNPTQGEKAMWNILRMGRLSGLRFLRQHPILHNQNNRIYFFIADFYCHEHRLIIEVDGDIHDSEEQREHDLMRSETLTEMRYNILRFGNKEVISKIEYVLDRIMSEIES